MSLTKIVATIGPASNQVEVLSEMLRSGLSVARMNFSHGSHESHQKDLYVIRQAMKSTGIQCAVLQDLCGPKIRIGDFETGSVTLKEGKHIVLTHKKILGTAEKVSISYPLLYKYVSKGARILLNDGKNELVVLQVRNKDIITRVVVGGEIKGRRGVNVPGAYLPIASLTKKDKDDLLFGIKNSVDFVAFSFVRSAKDVNSLRALLKNAHSQAKIIAKIETAEAIENLEEIVNASDGIMVARGDLAVEVDPARVPLIQKKLVMLCRSASKPVIVATHMLESMTHSKTPTRAEVSDVANAVYDGADAVMLSAESAIGAYPSSAVSMMSQIATLVEGERGFGIVECSSASIDAPHTIADAAIKAAKRTSATAIVAFTESGSTARLISRTRCPLPILSLTPHQRVAQQLSLSYGCESHLIEDIETTDEIITVAKRYALASGHAKKGDSVVIVAGIPFGKQGSTNMLLVVRV